MRFVAASLSAMLIACAVGTSDADARSHHGHGHHQGSLSGSAAADSRDVAKTKDQGVPQSENKGQGPQGPGGQENKPANDPSTRNDVGFKGEHGRHGSKQSPDSSKGEIAHSPMLERTVTPSSNAHTGGSDEIDTRITTIQPRWRNGKAQKPQQHSKFVLVKPAHNVSQRRPAAFGADKNIARDSVGVALGHPQNERGQNEHDHDLVRSAAPVSAGITGNAPDNSRSIDRHPVPQPKPMTRLNPVPFNSGTINPSGPMRPHGGPATVGGSPKLIAGISGNMFKPRY